MKEIRNDVVRDLCLGVFFAEDCGNKLNDNIPKKERCPFETAWSCHTTPVGWHPVGCGCYICSTSEKQMEKDKQELYRQYRKIIKILSGGGVKPLEWLVNKYQRLVKIYRKESGRKYSKYQVDQCCEFLKKIKRKLMKLKKTEK